MSGKCSSLSGNGPQAKICIYLPHINKQTARQRGHRWSAVMFSTARALKWPLSALLGWQWWFRWCFHVCTSALVLTRIVQLTCVISCYEKYNKNVNIIPPLRINPWFTVRRCMELLRALIHHLLLYFNIWRCWVAVNVTIAIVISVYLKPLTLHMRNNCVFTQVRG